MNFNVHLKKLWTLSIPSNEAREALTVLGTESGMGPPAQAAVPLIPSPQIPPDWGWPHSCTGGVTISPSLSAGSMWMLGQWKVGMTTAGWL